MPRLQYYQRENEELGLYRKARISNVEAEYLFGLLQRRFKFGQYLRFYGFRDSGNCTSRCVRLSNNPSILVLAHEVAHAVQYRKRQRKFGLAAQFQSIPKMRWHTNAHARLTRKLIGIIVDALPDAKETIASKEAERISSAQLKRERMERIKAEKASPAYKLARLNEQWKRWESKLKRAEAALKKLDRRIKIWEKKVV